MMETEKDYKYMVSVFCLTYNHEKYIRQTLDSILNQETEYSFKIIVHDDASTDATQEIVKEYIKKYPDVIIPIFQKENQFRKGINIVNEHLEELTHAKYIAYCEGDDFWTDRKKIQKQVEYMEANEACSLCVHNTKKVDESGMDIGATFNSSNLNTKYTATDVIEAGGGGLFHTSSFLFRTKLREIKPSCYNIVSVGDYPMAIYLATRGYVYYIPEIMSAYRVAAVQSWSAQFYKNMEVKKGHYLEMIKALKGMDSETEHKYKTSYEKVSIGYEYLYLYSIYDLYQILKNDNYRKLFMENPFHIQVKYIVKTLINKVKKN